MIGTGQRDRRRAAGMPAAAGMALFLAVAAGAAPPAGFGATAVEAIREEAVRPNGGPEGYPLPLATHWCTGSHPLSAGWAPARQMDRIERGSYLLPWFAQPGPATLADAAFTNYYKAALLRARDWKLPIVLAGTQWESALSAAPYIGLPPDENPNVVSTNGEVLSKVCPFGPVAPWRQVGTNWTAHAAMRAVQEWYPDPPKVFFLSNNEHAKLRWHEAEVSRRYMDLYGPGRSGDFRRGVTGAGWIERYRALQDAMRGGLENGTWKSNAVFIGYGAFGPSHFGRWSGWMLYSLNVTNRIDPNPLAWDGGSPSYYTPVYSGSSDFLVFSPQIEFMNLCFMIAEAHALNPQFWYEFSLWDGGAEKRDWYAQRGQSYSTARYAGMAQYGMWLTRPRAVREFRGWTESWDDYGDFFIAVEEAVARIHRNPVLREFWRHGERVPNPAHPHPYQELIPAEYQDEARWFLLDADVNKQTYPWGLYDEVAVYSLALTRGTPPRREWLVYAHSPLQDRADVTLTLPGYRPITVAVPQIGALYLVTEEDGRVAAVDHPLEVVGDPVGFSDSQPYPYGTDSYVMAGEWTNVLAAAQWETNGMRFQCTGWSFTNRAGSCAASGSGTEAVFTVAAHSVLRWHWSHTCNYLAAGCEAFGSVSAASGWYTNGEILSCAAQPDPGYRFRDWQGSGVPAGCEADNPLALTMDRPREIHARFLPQSARCWRGSGEWHASATNWVPEGLPGPGDHVFIESGSAVLAAPAAVASVTVRNGAVLTFTNWATCLAASGEVRVGSGGVLTCAGPFLDTEMSNRVHVVCSNFVVEADGRVHADGRGYAGGVYTPRRHGQGPGGGYSDYYVHEAGTYGGFGHLGWGSQYYMTLGGRPYGAPEAPEQPGSGGGGTNAREGGAGGGAVRIEAADRVTVDGAITANGEYASGPDYYGANSGSGGGIWITCRRIAGSGGRVCANGGAARSVSWHVTGGGGGRVAVRYDPAAQGVEALPGVMFEALPGWNVAAANVGVYDLGDIGSLWFPDTRFWSEDMSCLQGQLFGTNAWSVAALTLADRWVGFSEEGFALTVAGDVSLSGAKAGLSLGGPLSFNHSGGGAAGNGQYRYGEGVPAVLAVGGNLAITNRARMFVYSAATNASHPDCGARVSVGGVLRVETNAVLYLSSHPTNGGSARLEVGSLAVAAGGLIRADKGFAGGIPPLGRGCGPGGGRDGNYWNPSGAGCGGAGGGTGPVYGSSNAPALPGSGGQAGGNKDSRTHCGKVGGGLVRIEAAARIDLAGTISASHPARRTDGAGGGGSGGGVYLRCRVFAGTAGAAITADGGSTFSGGGGGGGRIAVWRVRDESAGTVAVSVAGGSGSAAGAAPGTVVWGWLPARGTVVTIR